MVVLCAVAVPDIVWAGRTVYQYDELGRLKKVIHENGKVTDYGFDPAGNRTNQTTFTGDAIGFSIDDPSVSEGGTLTFTVTKTGTANQPHSVGYATANGTAAAGSDYTATSGTLTFTASQTSHTITVATIEDTTFEGAETVLVDLSSPTGGATILDSRGTGTITNDDTAASFAINNVSVSEGGTLSFTVTKSGSTALSHNVSYTTADGTAAAGSDYTAKSGTLTFAAGQASQAITVATIEDTSFENAETVLVNLSGATGGATISDSQGQGTINNDDAAPSFAINNPSVSEGGLLTFTVTKSGATVMSHSVSYATANGTAVAGSDYGAKSGTLTFTSGQTSKGISVGTVEDTTHEPNETMFVNLSGATGGATIADSQGQGTITDDDPANQPPNAVNDGTSVNVFGFVAIYVLNNDSDPDGHTLTITSVTQPGLGTASIINGAHILYNATDGSPGADSFTYTISDGHGGTDTATVNVIVIGGGGGIPE